MSPWTAADIPDQTGRTVLVTGASSGLGLHVASALAAARARVLLACRDAERGKAAMQTVWAQTPGADLELVLLDLASLESVRVAAASLADRDERIDVLVNNAGVMAPPLRRTAEGFEEQIGVNHLGHFALTGLLLDRMTESSAPRVTTVSSGLHRNGRIDLDDLLWERRRYRAWAAYGQSKLANLLFTLELTRRAVAAGLPLLATAAHPGIAATALTRDIAAARVPILGGLFLRAARQLSQSPEMGALPLLYAATMPDVAPGDYFGPHGRTEQRGYPVRVARSDRAADAAVAAALWEQSEQLTGVTYPI
jgi:protochlorophyllide reductase